MADLCPNNVVDICIASTFEVSLWRHRKFCAFVKTFQGYVLDLDFIPHGQVISSQIIIGGQM
jgi:hypothetical protein